MGKLEDELVESRERLAAGPGGEDAMLVFPTSLMASSVALPFEGARTARDGVVVIVRRDAQPA